MDYDIKDINLAAKGRLRIEWKEWIMISRISIWPQKAG